MGILGTSAGAVHGAIEHEQTRSLSITAICIVCIKVTKRTRQQAKDINALALGASSLIECTSSHQPYLRTFSLSISCSSFEKRGEKGEK
jgi:hypothetical protein